MIKVIRERNFFQLARDSITKLGYKKFATLGTVAILFLGVVTTFVLLQQQQDIRQRAAVSEFIAPDLSPFVATVFENRFDLNGDGTPDSYWEGSSNPVNKTCTISMYDIISKVKKWDSTIPNCTGLLFLPIFHTKSFMGDATRDFTLVYAGLNYESDKKDFHLTAGDGATGQLRNFDLYMGNAESPATVRLKGIQVVDMKLPSYTGPSLFVRTSSDGFKGHLFYFPPNSSSYTEISNSLWGSPPFPGVDMPGFGYTSSYNTFNSDLVKCSHIPEATSDSSQCGVPDNGSGQGLFLDQAAVSDIDNDGVDDILTSYFWKYVVYPGKPKGQTQYVGAAQFELYYNPQNDNSACHSGRHYGVNQLVSVANDPFPEQVDVGGSPVDNFNDIYQNVSRNIALIKTSYHGILPTYKRTLAWNIPMGTSIPSCGANNTNGNSKLYDNSIHYPGMGILKDSNNKALYIDYNRFTQTSTNTVCAHTDVSCHNQILSTMAGNWYWEIKSITNGTTVKSFPNMYVWDIIPNNSTSVWLVYSQNANTWHLGEKDLAGNTKFRTDLTIALFDINTLSLSNKQVIAGNYFPYLKKQPAQNITTAFASIWMLNSLFTVPLTGYSLPGIVFKTPGGFELMVFNGNSWVSAAVYDSLGHAVPSDPSIQPTSTLTPTSTPSPTPSVLASCPTGNLVYFWNFDSANPLASQIGNVTGTNFNVTVSGGKLLNGVALNGISSYADFGVINNFERTQPFTISAWVNQSLGTQSKFIIARQDNQVNGAGYKLATDNNGNPSFSFGPDQNKSLYVGAQQDIRGGWHLLTVSYNGSSKGTGLKLYVDGVLKGTGGGSDLTDSTLTNETFRIGARENATFSLFQGTIDELGVWNRELTGQEIASLYNNGNGVVCSSSIASPTPTQIILPTATPTIPIPTPTPTRIPTPTPTFIPTPTPTSSYNGKEK